MLYKRLNWEITVQRSGDGERGTRLLSWIP